MALVLVVTDEPETLLLLRRDLEAAGHRVMMAADADTALERLAAGRVDVAIIDIMMPIGDGWTVLEAIRALAPRAIVMSARPGPIDMRRARRMGAVGWLASRPGAEDLVLAVAMALDDGAANPQR